MALLAPIFGDGRLWGNSGWWKERTIVDDTQINIGFNIEIQFLSPSGDYVGSLSTSPDGAGYINFEITEERIGGLKSFEFEIGRQVDIPFYPLLECQFFISGKHWYTGELIFKPNQDRREITYKYSGQGYWDYAKRVKMEKTYNNSTMSFVLNDMIQNFLEPNSRIIYNPTLIQPPSITMISFEIKNKDIQKTIERLLEIANYDYNTTQYVAGVDKNRQFYFLPVTNNITYSFYEGFQYQDPDVKEDLKKVINQVNIYRTQAGSSDVEYVTTVNDLDSQGKWGLNDKSITIPVYMDDATAIKLGQFIIEKNRDPLTDVTIKNLITEDEPYPIEKFYINNKIDNYEKVIAEFELLSEWALNIANTTINITTDKVLTGRRSFVCLTSAGSSGEYIEKIFDEEINFPNHLDLWLAQMENEVALKIYIWDVDGILIEQNINAKIINDFHRQRIDLTSLDNIKQIRIEFITNNTNTIYLDGLRVITQSWLRHELILDKIKYTLSRSNLLADATFGDKVDTLVDKLKKVESKQDDIYDIFEKI